jgi:hypothetical protein
MLPEKHVPVSIIRYRWYITSILLVLQGAPWYFAQNLSIEHSILFLNLNPPLLTIGVNVVFILLIQDWDCVQNYKNCSRRAELSNVSQLHIWKF